MTEVRKERNGNLSLQIADRCDDRVAQGDVVLIENILFPVQKCAVSCLEKVMFPHPK